MNKSIFLVFVVSFFISLILGFLFVFIARKINNGQPILKYVKEHKEKANTPTCGGLFFIISACATYFIFCGVGYKIATFSIVIGLSFMLVGFLDDFIKIKYKENMGLKPYQKMLFLCSISVVSGVFAYRNGLTYFYIPFYQSVVNVNYFTIFIIIVIFLAVTNGVNLTDGLDGLASGSSIFYFVFISILIYVEYTNFKNIYILKDEYNSLILLSVSLVGALCAFLIFNTNKAYVFMGDTGSLSLGGFVASIGTFSSNGFFIPILGIVYVISCLSVIIQVLYYKKTKKRVFLMAPFHHHLQLKGFSENRISYIYLIITCITSSVVLIFYL